MMNQLTTNLFSHSFESSTTTSTSLVLNRTNSIAELTKSLIPDKYQIILLSFAYGIISLLALIGNASIIYIVIHTRRMHSVTNYFICNLALADCLVACFAIPFQVKFIPRLFVDFSFIDSFSFKRQFYRNGFYRNFCVN